MIAKRSLKRLDQLLEANQESSHRGHLGASALGRKCARHLFYLFRWAASERFSGQMLRLFGRGHNAEAGFHDHLRLLGAEVWPCDPDTGNQWRVTFAGGHGGGSADGVARGGLVELDPEIPYLTECKTHNDKSFTKLTSDGLMSSKPEHFAQMQIYMSGLGLTHGLYMAVNKNDDHLHLEVVRADPDRAHELVTKAENVVFATRLPERAFNSPAWFECKWCVHAGVCWRNQPVERNCRTCQFAKPEADGTWSCSKGRAEILNTPQAGCAGWKQSEIFRE